MFANVKIKNIVISSNIIFMMIILALGSVSVFSISAINSHFVDVTENTVPSVITLSRANTDANAVMVKMGSHILAPTTAETLKIDREIPILEKKVDDGYAKYRHLISDPKDAALFKTAEARWTALKAVLVDVRRESLAMNTAKATNMYNHQAIPAVNALVAAVRADMEYNQQLMQHGEDSGKSAVRGGTIAAIFAIVAGGAVGAFLIFMSFGRIIRPLGSLTHGLQRMAAGELDIAVSGANKQDEIGEIARAVDGIKVSVANKAEAEAAAQRRVVDALGQGLDALARGDLTFILRDSFPGEYDRLRVSFNSSVEGLEENLSRVAQSAQAVHSGATEIRAASEDLSRRTEQQAASLEETTAAMGQVTNMVGDTARSASDVRNAVDAAHKDASEGGNVVRQAVEAMDAIEKSSQEINNIINLIDGISFQTNLLALNAGVEAARAGDAGKGFAVVANEVRALAQRSADAASDIKNLINKSGEQVSSGVELVGETGKMLERIVSKISEINALIVDIASSTEQQAASLHQVNGAVGDMDRMTQQNAAMVEESTAATRSLAGEADELAALVAQFQLNSTNGQRHGSVNGGLRAAA